MNSGSEVTGYLLFERAFTIMIDAYVSEFWHFFWLVVKSLLTAIHYVFLWFQTVYVTILFNGRVSPYDTNSLLENLL